MLDGRKIPHDNAADLPLVFFVLVELVAVAYLTRATRRRVMGALVGGASAGLVALGAITLCKALGWWQIWLRSILSFALLLCPLALAGARSTRHLAISPEVRLAWPSDIFVVRGGHRTSS